MLKEAANAFIPEAVKQLSYLYSEDYRSSENYRYYVVGRDDRKSERLKCIFNESKILDMLQIMELNYECPKVVGSEILLCKQCGNIIKIGKKFCSQCGEKVQ